MTCEEKINTLKAIIQECEEYQWQRKEALFEIIKDLEQDPCDEAISRKEVHRQINKWVASGESDNDLMSLHNRVDTLPPVNLVPYEDAISRQAVLDIAKSSKSNWIDNSVLFKRVNELPSVTPQPKMGRWVKHDTGHSIYYDCSLCGGTAPCTETADKIIWKMANYCPDCGAKMEVENYV